MNGSYHPIAPELKNPRHICSKSRRHRGGTRARDGARGTARGCLRGGRAGGGQSWCEKTARKLPGSQRDGDIPPSFLENGVIKIGKVMIRS